MSYIFYLRRPRTTQERRNNQQKNGGYHRPKRSYRRLPDTYDDLWVSFRIYRNWKKQYKISPANSRDGNHRRTHQHHVRCMGCGVTIRRFVMSKHQRRKQNVNTVSEAPLHCL